MTQTASAATALARSANPRTHFGARRWIPALLFAGDLLALECAVLLGYLARMAAGSWFPVALSPLQFRGIALGIVIVPLACLISGLYPGYGLATVERLRRRAKAIFFSFAGLIAWGYLAHRDEWSRGILLAAMLFTSVLAPAVERLLIRALLRSGRWGAPVAVFGSTDTGAELANRLRKHPALGLNPVAVYDFDFGGIWSGRALSTVARLQMQISGTDGIQTAVVAWPDHDPAAMRQFVEALPARCVILMSASGHPQSQSITAIDMGGDLGLVLTRNLLIPWNRRMKRAIDVVASAALLVVVAPLVALCAWWIRRVSPDAGAFFKQERIGYGNRPFGVWKLRTMHPNAERMIADQLVNDPQRRREWETNCKLREDPRILPGVGNLLRRTSIDELPQLWNVFKGEMSLVGPRPFPAYHMDRFSEDFQRMRGRVYPGITGLWQVSSREGNLQVQESLDSYYIRNWSLWLDIDIAIRTIRAVWEGRGAC